ncbi:ankyrin repeat protein [Anaeramoeba flamelloides]|uniref:Ankyrin repeat protein n=1 Tax=Anaeramoeba flamelloides TaxID=1746091 RepID=A0ABQ8YXR3_9EUKA|nr:ankyrin repeat protein [Anaeramoeba flamelloides]
MSIEIVDYVYSNSLAKVKSIFENKKVNINEIIYDRTLLHWSCTAGKLEITKFLLSNGADVNSTDATGRTPLHEASDQGRDDLIKILLDAGSEINQIDQNGHTALYCAVLSRKISAVEALIKGGARLDFHFGDEGKKALHLACNLGRADMVELLIAYGANVNAITSKGFTPLHSAIENGSVGCVEVLLQNNADVNLVFGDQKKTALHYATQIGNIQMCVLLLKYGADPTIQDDSKSTPADLACQPFKSKLQKYARVFIDYCGAIIPEFIDEYQSCLNKTKSQLKVNPNLIKQEHIIGKGGFSKVYQGQYKGNKIAIKKFHDELNTQNYQMFKREVALYSKCDHPNIIKIVGYNCNGLNEISNRKILNQTSRSNQMSRSKKENKDKNIHNQISNNERTETKISIDNSILESMSKLYSKYESKYKQEFMKYDGLKESNESKEPEFNISNNSSVMLLEYCSNDLEKKIKSLNRNQNTFHKSRILKLILEIAQGMKYLHANEIVHRDLKPANIFLSELGHVKIADFGLSIFFHDSNHQNQNIPGENRKIKKFFKVPMSVRIGTDLYMAPEMMYSEQDKCSFPIDVFSFGLIMYEIATLKKPIKLSSLARKGADLQNSNIEMPPNNDCHQEIINLIYKCLDREPKKRPTFKQICNILENIAK